MIQLKTFNKKELEEFVSSGAFRQYDFLPITKHRAISQINNPRATEDHTLLILALYEGKLAGYVGCFPDYFVVEGQKVEYAWLSTLYVNPEFQKKRPAKKLLKKVFEEYGGRIAITEFTKEAEALYIIMGVFEDVFPKDGKRYYFRTDATGMIPEKKPKTRIGKPLFYVLDTVANSLISLKNLGVEEPKFKYEILDRADQESIDFVAGFSENRSAEEINTFIDHPWILEGKKEEKYFFSSFAGVFKYFWIKIYDDSNKLAGCLLLQLRDGYLKIPYFFSKTNDERIVAFLSYFVILNKVKGFTCYHTGLNEAIQQSKVFPKIYERGFRREYLFHKQLLEELPEQFNPHFQDGDGDCMMT
ncbi:GNAT family N-acetyltransferase [Chryseobacterium sp. BIGb0232]|uniref:GNAT family N-acetyltransferase n=1 Tax=Chryseobacterium sp. BIGb0232 TaxID=2940598 RepID=UPI000F467A75|nr:GNAT family N-acetyltransferase [Chryseobacterium sp. BIGb0232]MCS4305685.1 GNAT superfamily N-acetyltransferase [Chryseobacterium sp. BIGb0232]ROS06553.1 acetyltransferase (GNAT) family protein [Chryseobacterium nakagawai]